MEQFVFPTQEKNLLPGTELLRAMFDGFVDAVVACDANGEMRYFNRVAAALHGLEESAIAGGDWPSRYDLLKADGVTPFDAANSPLLRTLREGSVHDLRFSIRPRNGRPIVTVLARGEALYGEQGELVGAMLVMSDISAQAAVARQRQSKIITDARRKAREDYADRPGQTEHEFRDLVDVSPQVVWKANRSGQITYINDYWYRLTDRSPQESLGVHYINMMHPDDRLTVMSVWQASMQHRDGFETEVRFIAGNHQILWFLVRAVPECGNDGEIHHWVGTAVDITARKVAEQALQSHVRMLEQINHVSASVAAELRLEPLMQVVTDAAVRVTGAQFGAFFHTARNPEGEEYTLYALSGISKDAFSNYRVPRQSALLAPNFSAQGIKRCDDITADPAYGESTPFYGMPDGYPTVRSYLSVPVYGRSGEIYGAVFLGHCDVAVFSDAHAQMVQSIAMQASIGIVNSRLYEMRESLLEAERLARASAERESRLKEEFLATISHELRTPLNAIVGWSGVLANKYTSDAGLGKALTVIERNAKAQARIIDDLISMSSIISGKLPLNVAPIDLRRVVLDAIDNLRPATDAKGIHLLKDMGGMPAIVSGDSLRLHQVFWNILSNALKFSSRETTIAVAVLRHEQHIEVSITDQGRGISREFMPYLFDRFRQEDGSITRQHGGLGLGLAIARSLVEQHGGQITAHSEGINAGAKIVVSLPEVNSGHAVVDQQINPASSHVDDEPGTDLIGVKIMLVDDDDEVLDYLRELLMGVGAIVATAASVRIALDLMSKDRPDVLLCDIFMPVEGGFDLIHRLRQQETEDQLARIPAIAITGMAEAINRAHVFRASFNGYLVKPVDGAELIAQVANLVQH